MKKMFAAIVAATVCVAAVGCLTGCKDDRAGGENSLVYNVRYIRSVDIHDDREGDQDYYIFFADGTGKYYSVYSRIDDKVRAETITFKYVFLDDDKSGVACFFHSVERGEVGSDNMQTFATDDNKKWDSMVEVSKNAIATVGTYGYTFWINENYIDELPNYQKR